MPFAVNTPKGQVSLMDLPLEAFCRIEDETGERFIDVVVGPAKTAKVALAVYRAACEHVGAQPQPLSPGKLVGPNAVFEFVEDPTDPDEIVFEAGVPKSEDAPATTGSSGAPADTSGRPTSPGVSPSETSDS